MTRHADAVGIAAFAAVAVAGVLLRPALPVDETRYLAVAWEMWSSGDWTVPTKNLAVYAHKPPLLFWAINLVWSVTGVSEIAGRLVGPAFAVLALALTGRLARALWPDEPGIGGRAVVALAGMGAFAVYGGATMFDAALAAATLAGMLALVRAVRTGGRGGWILVGAALGVGGLVKGPVILVHLMPAVVLAPLWARGDAAPTMRGVTEDAAIALGTGLAAAAAWVVPAIAAGGPAYRDAILWTQSAGRMADSFAHAQPWWFLLAALPALTFPWIAVPALWRAGARHDWGDPASRLCLIWAGSALLAFSMMSGKQAHYLVPELPAAALVVARLSRARFALTIPAAVAAAMAVLGAAAAAGLLLLGRAAALLEPRSTLLAWAFLTTAVALTALRLRGLAGGAVLTLGTVLAVDLLLGLTAAREAYDTHRIAAAIAPHREAGIAFYGATYHAEFNFAGRLTAPVAVPGDAEALAAWQTAHPAGIVVARTDRRHPGWRPWQEVAFRNAPYAIWRVADAPVAEPSA